MPWNEVERFPVGELQVVVSANLSEKDEYLVEVDYDDENVLFDYVPAEDWKTKRDACLQSLMFTARRTLVRRGQMKLTA